MGYRVRQEIEETVAMRLEYCTSLNAIDNEQTDKVRCKERYAIATGSQGKPPLRRLEAVEEGGV